jgi:hypothetical protein
MLQFRANAADHRWRRRSGWSICAVGLTALVACGGGDHPQRDDAGIDAPIVDAPLVDAALVDAIQPDAPPDAPIGVSQNIVSAGGRIQSATYTFDITLGAATERRPASGSTHTLAPTTAVKP